MIRKSTITVHSVEWTTTQPVFQRVQVKFWIRCGQISMQIININNNIILNHQSQFSPWLVSFRTLSLTWTPCGKGTVVSIVSCRCTYCCPKTSITRHYSRYCAVAFLLRAHVWTVSHVSGHDFELHPHREKLYPIWLLDLTWYWRRR